MFKSPIDSRFSDAELLQAIAHANSQPWVQQQITADLAPFKNGISHQQLETWFINLNDGLKYSEVVKFNIVDGIVNTDSRSDIHYTIAYETVREVLQILASKKLIPDCELIVKLSDCLNYVPKEIHDPVAVFTFAKHTQIPVEKDTILIPDWENVHFGYTTRARIKFASNIYPWQNKQNLIHWRGGPADSMHHRSQLVTLGSKLNFIDAGFITDNNQFTYLDPEFSLQYKYQIALDGARCTWTRMVWQLHANTLLIKPDSPQIQWYFRGLQPYTHYLPIAAVDEARISAAYNWLQAHDSQAKEISRHANLFAQDNLKTQDFIAYYAILLQQYAKLLNKQEPTQK